MTKQSPPRHFHGTEIKPDTETKFRSVCSTVRTSIEQSLRNDLDTALKCLSWLESGRDKEVERLELAVAELSQENGILVNDIQDAAAEAEELCESLSNCHDRLKTLEDTVKIITSERDLIAEKYHEIEVQGNSTRGENENKLSAERSQERFRFSMIVQEQNRTFEAMKQLRQENTELEKEKDRLLQLKFCPDEQERGQEGVEMNVKALAIQTKEWFSNSWNGGSTEGPAGVGADKHHRQRASFHCDGVVGSSTKPHVAPKHIVNAVRDPIDTRTTKNSQKKETKKVLSRRPPQPEMHSFDVSFSYFDEV
jgi:hypothetical protein